MESKYIVRSTSDTVEDPHQTIGDVFDSVFLPVAVDIDSRDIDAGDVVSLPGQTVRFAVVSTLWEHALQQVSSSCSLLQLVAHATVRRLFSRSLDWRDQDGGPQLGLDNVVDRE